MEFERSNSIRVTLVYTNGTHITPIIEVPGNNSSISTPIPIGTVGPIQSSFGSDYSAFIRANIAGSAFDIQAVTDTEYQVLDQPRINWEWNVIPKYMGLQILNLNIVIEWKPVNGGTSIIHQLWRQRLEVDVQAPVFVTGRPIEVLPIITGVGGTILGGLITFFGSRIYQWLLQIIRKFKDDRTQRIRNRGRRR